MLAHQPSSSGKTGTREPEVTCKRIGRRSLCILENKTCQNEVKSILKKKIKIDILTGRIKIYGITAVCLTAMIF